MNTKQLRKIILKHLPRLVKEYYRDGNDHDWWNAVKVDGVYYDINIVGDTYHNSEGKLQVSAYRVSKISNQRYRRHIPIATYDERRTDNERN